MSILSSLRSFLRRWLEIEHQQVALDHLLNVQDRTSEKLAFLIREEVRQQLRDMVVGTPEHTEASLHKVLRRGEGTNALLFERSLRYAIGSWLSRYHEQAVRDMFNKIVEPEAFVDQIVDRILRKQLEVRHSTGA
jgi:hypothetical protein